MGPFFSWGSLKVNFGFGGHFEYILGDFGFILGLGVTFGSFWVRGHFWSFWIFGTLWVHLGFRATLGPSEFGGDFSLIFGLGVTLGPFRVWGSVFGFWSLWV